MTTDKSPAAADREKILEEHRRIAELASSIADARDLDEMATGLQRLQSLLEPHFQREEELDGLHDSIRERAPHYVAAVKRLGEEHGALLAELRDLRARVGQCAAGRIDAFGEIQQGFRTLVRDLREHEARENEVFLDTWNDLGTGD